MINMISSVILLLAASAAYGIEYVTNESGQKFVKLGDMLLDLERYNRNYGPPQPFDPKQPTSGMRDKRYRWPKKEIPYQIASGYSEAEQRKIKNGIDQLNDALSGCLKIRPAQNGDKQRVIIRNGKGCNSYVGRITGGTQDMNLQANGCLTPGTVMHEFIHAIGFQHEQTRSDRDNFITVHLDNIQRDYRNNFDKETEATTDTFGLPYDYESIMHYEHKAFAIDRSRPTMTSKQPQLGGEEMGSETLSKLDIAKIRAMYGCKNPLSGQASSGRCPSSHPFAYMSGYYCCSSNREGIKRADGAACDGSKISLSSSCCRGNIFVKCPHGSCRNAQ